MAAITAQSAELDGAGCLVEGFRKPSMHMDVHCEPHG